MIALFLFQVHATAQAVINHHSQTASSVTSQPQSHQGSAHSNASTNSIEMKQSTPSSNLVPKKFPGGAARTTALTSQEAIVTPTSIPDITAAKHSDTSSSTHVALTDTNQKHSSNDSPQIKAKVSLLPPGMSMLLTNNIIIKIKIGVNHSLILTRPCSLIFVFIYLCNMEVI